MELLGLLFKLGKQAHDNRRRRSEFPFANTEGCPVPAHKCPNYAWIIKKLAGLISLHIRRLREANDHDLDVGCF
jgi:hypothetical protein